MEVMAKLSVKVSEIVSIMRIIIPYIWVFKTENIPLIRYKMLQNPHKYTLNGVLFNLKSGLKTPPKNGLFLPISKTYCYYVAPNRV